jgi:hypothetical protein
MRSCRESPMCGYVATCPDCDGCDDCCDCAWKCPDCGVEKKDCWCEGWDQLHGAKK